MNYFSREFEKHVGSNLLQLLGNFLENYTEPKPKLLGLISAEELKEDLHIKSKTLERWEGAGLKKYKPPIEGTRKSYYRVTDVLVFLGVEKHGKI